MAVKKVGQDESVVKQCTCRNCGAILEYLPKDVETKTYCSFGDTETSSYIYCPECSKPVQVK